jgi:uncharacterized protein Veg
MEKLILMTFDRKSRTIKTEVNVTTIIRIFHRRFKKGKNRMNKQMGSINREYNSSFVINVKGIAKKPKVNKYFSVD